MKIEKKLKRYLPLTKKQLYEIVKCYAMAFPDWKVVGGRRLVRISKPMLQQIGFEALRSGGYRPAMVIRVLPLPIVRMLHQFLDIKHRDIELRDHPTKWKSVVVAMEQQFKPLIRKPLDLREIKELCEQNAMEKTNDLCMLAILSAYLGEKDQALSYCERIQNAPTVVTPRPDWELQHQEFGRQLRQAIEAGNERQFLDNAAKVNKAITDLEAENKQQ